MGFTNTTGTTISDKRIFLNGIDIKGGDITFIAPNLGHLVVNKIKPVSDYVTVYSSLSVTGTLSAGFDLSTQGTTASATDASNRLATTAFVYNAIPHTSLFSTVNSNSAAWAATYSSIVYTNSAGWANAESTARAGSAAWWTTHSAVTANSAAWDANEGETTVRNNSANWNLAHTTSVANTAAISHFRSSSADWANTYSTVKTESAGWEAGSGGTITALNNATENELVTIGNTTTELDAEANLTFDGSILKVEGDIEVAGSVKHKGDTDTYINFNDDEIMFKVGGKNLFAVTEAGVEQIVINDIGNNADFRVEGLNEENLIFTDGSVDKVGIGTAVPNALLTVAGNISASGELSAGGTGDSYFAGNVGIGTSTPDYKLDVAGSIGIDQRIYHNGDANTNINLTDDRIRFEAGNLEMLGMHKKSSSPHQVTINNGANNVDFVVKDNSNNKTIFLDASKNKVGIGGVEDLDETLTVAGSISAQTDILLSEDQRIYFEADKATWIESHAADSFRLVAGGSTMLTLDLGTGDRAVFGYGTKVYIGYNNNAVPSKELEVAGAVSALGVIYASGGDSTVWNTTRTTVHNNSAGWENTESTVRSNSGSWGSTSLGHVNVASGAWWTAHSTVSANSGDWNNTETVTRANSGDWENTESTVRSNSGSWGTGSASVGHVPIASGAWWTAHSTVSANSSDWNNNETVTRANSGDWETAYDNMVTTMSFATGTGILTLTQQDGGTVTEDLDNRYITSSVTGVAGYVPSWGSGTLTLGETVLYHSSNRIGINTTSLSVAFTVSGAGTQEASISARDVLYAGGNNSIEWTNAYKTVKANSGDWENVWTSVNADSADWNNTETVMRANSGDWNNAETTLRANSSDWENAWTTTNSTSSVWTTVNTASTDWSWAHAAVLAGNGDWDSVYSTTRANSGDWENAWATTNSTSSVWTTVNTASTDWSWAHAAVFAGNGDWDSVYSTVRSNSGSWGTGGTGGASIGHVPIASGAWWSTHSYVSASSADWNNTETVVRDASADWNNTDSTVGSGSAKWWSTHNAVTANSGAWGNTTSTVKSKSGDWNNVWTSVNTDSADWNNAWSVQNTNSANWITTHSGVLANSADWENVWTTVNTDSADWNNAETALRSNSGDWNNNETVTRANSATWGSGGTVNTTVNANSAVWSYPLSAQRVATEVTVSNSFAVGNILRKGTGTNYHKAQADSASNADVIGVVIAASSSKFTYVHSGYATIASHGFTIGNIVFLSDSSAGALTETETSTIGSVTKPIGTVIDSNTILVEPLRGMIITSNTSTASAAAGWTRSGTLIYASETSDTVSVGTNIAGEKLTVKGNISASGNIYAAGDLTVGGTLTATGALVTSGIHNYGHTNTIQPEFSATNLQVGVISGPATISTTHNKQAGASITLRLSAYDTNCALTWNSSWIFVGTKPTILPTDKYGVLSLQCFGTADTDVVASFAISN